MTQISPELVAEAKRYLSPSQDDLVNDVIVVLKTLEHDHINDYSFVVAPAAKAFVLVRNACGAAKGVPGGSGSPAFKLLKFPSSGKQKDFKAVVQVFA